MVLSPPPRVIEGPYLVGTKVVRPKAEDEVTKPSSPFRTQSFDGEYWKELATSNGPWVGP